MSIQLAKCKECQNFPDIAWMAQGGNTPQNVWAQVTKMCRDCWAFSSKRATLDMKRNFEQRLATGGFDGTQ
jgi:hypothetical protein